MKAERQKIRVRITTDLSVIVGDIHIMPGGRISDYLNSAAGKFIPVSDAVYCKDNGSTGKKTQNGQAEKEDLIFINAGEI